MEAAVKSMANYGYEKSEPNAAGELDQVVIPIGSTSFTVSMAEEWEVKTTEFMVLPGNESMLEDLESQFRCGLALVYFDARGSATVENIRRTRGGLYVSIDQATRHGDVWYQVLASTKKYDATDIVQLNVRTLANAKRYATALATGELKAANR